MARGIRAQVQPRTRWRFPPQPLLWERLQPRAPGPFRRCQKLAAEAAPASARQRLSASAAPAGQEGADAFAVDLELDLLGPSATPAHRAGRAGGVCFCCPRFLCTSPSLSVNPPNTQISL